MFFSLLSDIFSKNKAPLFVPDSVLLKKIQDFSDKNLFSMFKNAKIFHHKDILDIPLLLVGPKRGIYIFEYKTWCYDEIKNFTAARSSHLNPSQNSLAFESKHAFIKKRFSEVINNHDIHIFNFVIMENLTRAEYYNLDDSFHKLIPQSKTLFKLDSSYEIKEKILGASEEKSDILDINTIISTLFVQNTILSDNGKIKATSKEQNNIIFHHFSNVNYISCAYNSGKTTTILLKALYEHLIDKSKEIVILEPTNTACELLNQKLLDTVEYSIVEVDFSKISIFTPQNFNQKKADILLVDDAFMLDADFINSLVNTKNDLIIFEDYRKSNESRYFLTNSYQDAVDIEYLPGDPYALTFINIQRALNNGAGEKDILIVTTNDEEKEKINEDLLHFVEHSPTLLDPDKSINNQKLDHLLIAKYDDLSGITRDYLFLFNPKEIKENFVNFVFSRAKKKIFVIYSEDNNFIGNLYAKDFKDTKRVERDAIS